MSESEMNKRMIFISGEEYRDYYRKSRESTLPKISSVSSDDIVKYDEKISLPTVRELRNLLSQVDYDDEDKHVYILKTSGPPLQKTWEMMIEINEGCAIVIG